MSTILVFVGIISIVLLLIGFSVSLLTNFDSNIGLIIFFCGLILAGITYFAGIHNEEVINTETEVIETESTTTETDKAVENLITSFRGEDAVESEKDSETSEETKGASIGITIIAMLVIFSPVLLFIGLDLIDGITDSIVDLIGTCFLKKNKKRTNQYKKLIYGK